MLGVLGLNSTKEFEQIERSNVALFRSMGLQMGVPERFVGGGPSCVLLVQFGNSSDEARVDRKDAKVSYPIGPKQSQKRAEEYRNE